MKALRKVLFNRKGAVMVAFVAAAVSLIGFSALAVDIGLLTLYKYEVTNAADASALAGAQELPAKPDQSIQSALSIAAANGREHAVTDTVGTQLSKSDHALTVSVGRTVPLFLAKVWGLETSRVTATATAEVKTYSGGGIGIVPFGIEKQTFVFGQTYRLKLGGGSGYNGNFQALALGVTGASNYRDNIKYGYKGQFKIGDWIPTETGNMSGPTSAGVSYRLDLDPGATFETVKEESGRVIIVPVIDSLLVSGRTDVLIVGFAAFFLEGSGGGGNDSFVYGKFRQMVIPGDYSNSANYYGLSVAVLSR